jgi:hypothetical protein
MRTLYYILWAVFHLPSLWAAGAEWWDQCESEEE